VYPEYFVRDVCVRSGPIGCLLGLVFVRRTLSPAFNVCTFAYFSSLVTIFACGIP